MAQDFVFSVVLKAENGGLVGQLKLSKAEFDAMKAAAKGAAGELKGVDAEQKKQAVSARSSSQASREAKAAFNEEKAAAQALKAEQRRLEEVRRAAASQTTRQRAGLAQLGQQIQDVSYQFSAGVPAMIIFAQQGGQVATALQGFGGVVGRVAGFLAGPWGAALTGAGLVVAALAGKLDYASKAADELENASGRLAEAEKALKEIRGETILTTQEIARQTYDLALQRREEAKAALTQAEAELALAEARRQSALALVSTGKAGGELGSGLAFLEQSRIDAQRVRIAELNKEIALLGQDAEKAFGKLAGAGIRVEDVLAGTNGGIRDSAVASREAALAVREHSKQLEELAAAARLAAASLPDYSDPADIRAIFRKQDTDAERERADTGLASAVEAADRRIAERMEAAGSRFGERAAERFGDDALVAAEAIGQAIGGKLGGVVQTVVGVLGGLGKGDFTALGGKAGGLLTLFSRTFGKSGPFADGLKTVFMPIRDAFKDLGTKLGIGAGAQKFLGQAAGAIAVGSTTGKLADGLLDAVGVKSSKLGAQIGGTIGTLVGGPIGAAIGSVLGGIAGGLLKKTKFGRATITGVDADPTVVGNSGSRRQAASGLAGSVQDTLRQIADQLGGSASGAFNVSIGVRGKDFRVNTAGGSLKKKRGALDFNQDEGGAVMAAAQAALAQGAITGLSDAVQRALKSSPDLDKALKEALTVQDVEGLIGGISAGARKVFADFERQAAERNRVARKYGFDLVEIERLTGEQRTALFEGQVAGAVGGLKRLIDELRFGGKAGGSAVDRRQALLDEAARLEGRAATDTSAANRLAEIYDLLYEASEAAFGTAGQFAGDRSRIQSTAERLVADTEARLRAEQTAARTAAGTDKTAEKLDTTNATLDEIADGIARMNAALGRLVGAGVGDQDLDATMRLAQARALGATAFAGRVHPIRVR